MTLTNTSVSKVVIIDDDRLAVEKLGEMLGSYLDLEVTGTVGNSELGMEVVRQRHPDLVFIDIDLPDGNGLDLASRLQSLERPPYVVMYTAFYNEYSGLDRVFKNGECDYLLKPIDPAELDKTIRRYRHSMASGAPMASLHPMPSREGTSTLVVLTSATTEMRVLRISDIGYFHYNSVRKLWEVVLNDHTVISLRKSSSATDILHYSDKFIQTHQSYIVNMEYMLLLSSKSVKLLPPFDKEDFPVGRTYFKSLQKRFMSL